MPVTPLITKNTDIIMNMSITTITTTITVTVAAAMMITMMTAIVAVIITITITIIMLTITTMKKYIMWSVFIPETAKSDILQNLGCAHCAAKMEEKINNLPGVTAATITYTTKQLRLSAKDPDKFLPEVQKICASIESEVKVVSRDELEKAKKQASAEGHSHEEEGDDKKELACIISGAILFAIGIILNHTIDNTLATFIIFAIAYVILGGEILVKAAKNISHGQVFDENFLMGIATLGCFCHPCMFPEAVGVMLFYRIGEFFEA